DAMDGVGHLFPVNPHRMGRARLRREYRTLLYADPVLLGQDSPYPDGAQAGFLSAQIRVLKALLPRGHAAAGWSAASSFKHTRTGCSLMAEYPAESTCTEERRMDLQRRNFPVVLAIAAVMIAPAFGQNESVESLP